MSDPTPPPGTIGWIDLTVPDAAELREFYADVVGWTTSEVEMGDGDERWSDFNLHPEGGDPVAGLCHARGPNRGLPAAWLIYVTVADLDASLAAVEARGGEIVREARSLGSHGRFAVIRDPAGAVLALHEAAA